MFCFPPYIFIFKLFRGYSVIVLLINTRILQCRGVRACGVRACGHAGIGVKRCHRPTPAYTGLHRPTPAYTASHRPTPPPTVWHCLAAVFFVGWNAHAHNVVVNLIIMRLFHHWNSKHPTTNLSKQHPTTSPSKQHPATNLSKPQLIPTPANHTNVSNTNHFVSSNLVNPINSR